ncbi:MULTISPECIES: methyltransferase domain-containing protein [unclassified Streptomyces]|uniref:methyltransferase domain-containing protein n=1 Tax=unclassified Streptomyces TaxID=2593676 RepID=UPI00344D5B6E
MPVDTGLQHSGEFTRVDSAKDSNWFIRFMDLANALPEYGAVRRTLAEGLGPLTGRHILDVGCGTGDDARELAALVGPEGRVTGVDLSEAMVGEARGRSAGSPLPAEFAVGDIRRLDFADGSFDGVRVKLVRQHCPDLDEADHEVLRVTRRGGRIAVFDYDFDTLTVDHPDREATRTAVHAFCDNHRHGWNARSLENRFLDLGVTGVTLTPHTVRMSYAFFQASLGEFVNTTVASGGLAWTPEELAAWWQPLEEAEKRGRFFASISGFALSGTR